MQQTSSALFPIGKIVSSNSHIDYVCQVYGAGETPQQPRPADYAIGTFARIEIDNPGAGPSTPAALVGIVYNTLLVNPAFGTLGPRLSQRADLEVFSPDYLAETATLVGLVAVGWQDDAGSYFQGVPVVAATVNGEVTHLGDDERVAFHRGAGGAAPCLHYAPTLLALQNPIVLPLLLRIVDDLAPAFPQHQRTLHLLRSNLIWRRSVESVR